MKSILDPTFRYVKAHETNIRKTFARVRREMAQEAERAKAQAAVVTPIQKFNQRKEQKI